MFPKKAATGDALQIRFAQRPSYTSVLIAAFHFGASARSGAFVDKRRLVCRPRRQLRHIESGFMERVTSGVSLLPCEVNRLDRDGTVQDSQLCLSFANDLHLELKDIITIFFLESQRIALKLRIEHGRRLIRAVGGVRLL